MKSSRSDQPEGFEVGAPTPPHIPTHPGRSVAPADAAAGPSEPAPPLHAGPQPPSPQPPAPLPPAPISAEAVHELLAEVLALLAAEKEALVRLDRAAIDTFASRKLLLDARLQAVAQGLFDASAADQLRQIQERAFDNRLLLTHARACARGVLSLLAPEVSPSYAGGSRTSKPPPVALDLKG